MRYYSIFHILRLLSVFEISVVKSTLFTLNIENVGYLRQSRVSGFALRLVAGISGSGMALGI